MNGDSDKVKMKDRYTFPLKSMNDLEKYLGKDLSSYVRDGNYSVRPTPPRRDNKSKIRKACS